MKLLPTVVQLCVNSRVKVLVVGETCAPRCRLSVEGASTDDGAAAREAAANAVQGLKQDYNRKYRFLSSYLYVQKYLGTTFKSYFTVSLCSAFFKTDSRRDEKKKNDKIL